MAVTMTGEATLPAPRPEVWALLNDPAINRDRGPVIVPSVRLHLEF